MCHPFWWQGYIVRVPPKTRELNLKYNQLMLLWNWQKKNLHRPGDWRPHGACVWSLMNFRLREKLSYVYISLSHSLVHAFVCMIVSVACEYVLEVTEIVAQRDIPILDAPLSCVNPHRWYSLWCEASFSTKDLSQEGLPLDTESISSFPFYIINISCNKAFVIMLTKYNGELIALLPCVAVNRLLGRQCQLKKDVI